MIRADNPNRLYACADPARAQEILDVLVDAFAVLPDQRLCDLLFALSYAVRDVIAQAPPEGRAFVGEQMLQLVRVQLLTVAPEISTSPSTTKH